LFERVNEKLGKVFMMAKDMDSREIGDKIPCLLRAITIFKIYINICCGNYDHPALQPDSQPGVPLSETFIAIDQLGLLALDEETVYIALSLYDGKYPDNALVASIEYILGICKRHKYSPKHSVQELKGMNCFKINYKEGSVADGMHVNGGNGVQVNGVNNNNNKTDYNYIDLHYHAEASSGLIEQLSGDVHLENPQVSLTAIRKALNTLKNKSMPYIPISVTNGNLLVEEPVENGKILIAAQASDNPRNLRLYILRSFVDECLKNGSYFMESISQSDGTNGKYKSSPLENALRESVYHTMRERDLVLPGMPLIKPVNPSFNGRIPVTDTFPQVFKTLKAKSPERTPETELRIPNTKPNSQSDYGVMETNGDDMKCFENLCYRDVLIERLQECVVVTPGEYYVLSRCAPL
jgi:hypothetical protein